MGVNAVDRDPLCRRVFKNRCRRLQCFAHILVGDVATLTIVIVVSREECFCVRPIVGKRVTNKEVEIWDQSPMKDRRVRFAVDEEVRELTAEQIKQDRLAPIKIVGGRAWSPGIYQALRLLGKSLDVAWEKAFIHPLTFN